MNIKTITICLFFITIESCHINGSFSCHILNNVRKIIAVATKLSHETLTKDNIVKHAHALAVSKDYLRQVLTTKNHFTDVKNTAKSIITGSKTFKNISGIKCNCRKPCLCENFANKQDLKYAINEDNSNKPI